MKITEKINIQREIKKILTERYDVDEAISILKHFGVDADTNSWNEDTWINYNETFYNINDSVLIAIAEELSLDLASGSVRGIEPPKTWQENRHFRLFISHRSEDKIIANRIKETLIAHHINAFVAHEHIEPTKEWEKEIEKALCCMDAMLTIHTKANPPIKGFSESVWTQQEIGYALGRGIKIIPLKFNHEDKDKKIIISPEDPKGFLAKYQAVSRGDKDAPKLAQQISILLSDDPKTKDRMSEIQEIYKPKPSSNTPLLDDDIPF